MTDANDPIPQIIRDDEAAGSGDLVAGNIARLKALFPEIVTDGKVDFDVLRDLLGDEVEEGEERYGLNWKGKRKARAFAMTPSLGTLLPAPEDSVDWEATQNLMIEGDNLESLKLLRRSYAGKVKLIYIDPPYNTGNDFVYPDDYASPIRSYLSLIGISAADGTALSSNKDSSGRYHTDWLSMIYPRIVLAKELMRDDGVIMVSCDASENANLRLLLDEIFGSENYIEEFIWKKSYGGGAKEKFAVTQHEYILMYAKSADKVGRLEIDQDPERVKQYYIHTDEFLKERGPFRLKPLEATKSMDTRENLVFPIMAPDGSEILPKRQWWWSRERVERVQSEGGLHFAQRNGEWTASYKQYLIDENGNQRKAKPFSVFDGPYTQESSLEIRDLFDGRIPFQFPKPVKLMKNIVEIASKEDGDIVLDFFAGSGSTAHGLWERTASDGVKRRAVIVQLPEQLRLEDSQQKVAAQICDEIGRPRNIAELTKERLRRAGAKIRKEHPDAKVDTGFRVYKLATSNLKPWQPDADDLEASILDAVDNVMPGRTEEDLLVELLLKTGIDLTLPEEKRTIAGQTVHALGGGTLMVCLGNIGADDAEALGQGMADWFDALDPVQTTVYFKDTGLGADGNRAATKANLAAILRQRLGDRIAKIASI